MRYLWLLSLTVLALAPHVWCDADDPLMHVLCPSNCACATGSVSEVVVQCGGNLPTLPELIESLVTRLHINNSSTSYLPDDFLRNEGHLLNSLRSLRIQNSGIRTLGIRSFRGAKLLEEIELDSNNLREVPSEVFSATSCPSLRLLSLRNNPELNFPSRGPFLKSFSLQELDVSQCGITEISMHALARLPSLTYIDLADNSIQIIHPEAFAKLNYLEEIDFSGNKIVNLPSELPATLHTLRLRNNPDFNVSTFIDLSPKVEIYELDISQCNIDKLPRETLSRFYELTHLNLSHNALSRLYFPFILRRLRYLDLSHNDIHGRMENNLLSSCTSLETLRLGWNTGLVLPEEGFRGEFNSLYLLDISGCDITSISNKMIANFPSLAFVNVSNNALQALPNDIFHHCNDLNTVDLSYNEFVYLPISMFEFNPHLKHVSISSNPDLGPVLSNILFQNNSKLSSLDLSYCDLKEVPEILPSSLEVLKAQGNKFHDGSRLEKLIMKQLHKLEQIDISNNPWRCNFEFKQFISALRDRYIKDIGDSFDGWTDYMQTICVAERMAKENLFYKENALKPQEVIRSHFWSALSFAFIAMTFFTISAVIIVYNRKKSKSRRANANRYRQLDELSFIGTPSPINKVIYQDTTEPVHKPVDTIFTKTFLFPRFPTTETEIPASYVSGNYHHQQLVP